MEYQELDYSNFFEGLGSEEEKEESYFDEVIEDIFPLINEIVEKEEVVDINVDIESFPLPILTKDNISIEYDIIKETDIEKNNIQQLIDNHELLIRFYNNSKRSSIVKHTITTSKTSINDDDDVIEENSLNYENLINLFQEKIINQIRLKSKEDSIQCHYLPYYINESNPKIKFTGKSFIERNITNIIVGPYHMINNNEGISSKYEIEQEKLYAEFHICYIVCIDKPECNTIIIIERRQDICYINILFSDVILGRGINIYEVSEKRRKSPLLWGNLWKMIESAIMVHSQEINKHETIFPNEIYNKDYYMKIKNRIMLKFYDSIKISNKFSLNIQLYLSLLYIIYNNNNNNDKKNVDIMIERILLQSIIIRYFISLLRKGILLKPYQKMILIILLDNKNNYNQILNHSEKLLLERMRLDIFSGYVSGIEKEKNEDISLSLIQFLIQSIKGEGIQNISEEIKRDNYIKIDQLIQRQWNIISIIPILNHFFVSDSTLLNNIIPLNFIFFINSSILQAVAKHIDILSIEGEVEVEEKKKIDETISPECFHSILDPLYGQELEGFQSMKYNLFEEFTIERKLLTDEERIKKDVGNKFPSRLTIKYPILKKISMDIEKSTTITSSIEEPLQQRVFKEYTPKYIILESLFDRIKKDLNKYNIQFTDIIDSVKITEIQNSLSIVLLKPNQDNKTVNKETIDLSNKLIKLLTKEEKDDMKFEKIIKTILSNLTNFISYSTLYNNNNKRLSIQKMIWEKLDLLCPHNEPMYRQLIRWIKNILLLQSFTGNNIEHDFTIFLMHLPSITNNSNDTLKDILNLVKRRLNEGNL